MRRLTTTSVAKTATQAATTLATSTAWHAGSTGCNPGEMHVIGGQSSMPSTVAEVWVPGSSGCQRARHRRSPPSNATDSTSPRSQKTRENGFGILAETGGKPRHGAEL